MYREWLQRLEAFIADRRARAPELLRAEYWFESKPPLDADALAAFRAELDLPLPACLERFLSEASAGFTFQYLLNPGTEEQEEVGLDESGLLPVDALPGSREHCQWLVSKSSRSWIASDDPLTRAVWFYALPLTDLDADAVGEGLALWTYDPEEASPPVVWLKHDDAPVILENSFDKFLQTWEYFGYVDPRVLTGFCGDGTGIFRETPKARELRRELGLEG